MKEYLSVTAVTSEDTGVGESHSEEKPDATEPPPDGWIYLQDEFGNYYYYNESAGTRSVLTFPGILYTSLHSHYQLTRFFHPFSFPLKSFPYKTLKARGITLCLMQQKLLL
jgi:hypothetical protein